MTSVPRPRFDAVDEPWIPVRRGASPVEVSLRQALKDAHELGRIAGDVPTQEPVLVRLLLAVLYRALGGPQDLDAWRKLWEQPQLPAGPIDAYLNRWRHRFDLFDPAAPFMQCPAAPGERTKSAALLVAHLPTGNNVPLFAPRLESDPPLLTPVEALRWLLHTLAWDTAGIKTGRPGDPEARGGKSYRNPVGPLGDIGVVLPVAATLRETLLLNLVPYELLGVERPGDDLPAWEREPATAAWLQRPPTGPADQYTWLSRRVTLVPERAGSAWVVRQAIVGGGDRIAAGTRSRVEPHAAWEVKASPSAPPQHQPVEHGPAQQAWRGLGSLLAVTPGTRPPHALRWIGLLRDQGVAGLPRVVDAALFAMTYGAEDAVVVDGYWDELPLPVRALSERDPSLAQFVVACAGDADKVGEALQGLVRAVLAAGGSAGGDQQSRKALAEQAGGPAEELFHALDARFRRLLADLASGDDTGVLRQVWQRAVREQALGVADAVLGALPPAALARRADPANKRPSVWQAELRWRRQLREALPLAHEMSAQQEVG